MAKQGVEGVARHLSAVGHVEKGVIGLDVGEALKPFVFLDAAQFFALHLGDDASGLVRVVGGGGELGKRRLHGLGEQFFAQARVVGGPTLVGHPRQKGAGVEVNAMRVQAAIGPVGGHIAAFWVAVCVLGAIGADDARPTLAIGLGQKQTLAGEPRHDVIGAIIRQTDGAQGERIGFDRRHVQGGADVGQAVLALWVKLHQARGEVVAAGFQIHATRQAEITNRVAGAGVGVTRLGDGLDGRAELGLGRLVAEGVAPLK